MKREDFSETIAASDLNGSRSRQFIDYMKICEYDRSRSLLDFGPRSCTYKNHLDFLRNYCSDLNQILYESFQVQGNENLME